jgi:hypothetical protein
MQARAGWCIAAIAAVLAVAAAAFSLRTAAASPADAPAAQPE